MKKRLITGIAIGLIFIPLLILDFLKIPFMVVMGLLACIATFELLNVSKSQITYTKYQYAISIFSALIPYGGIVLFYFLNMNFIWLLVLVLPAVFLFILFLLNKIDKTQIKRMLFAIYYPSLGFGLISLLKNLNGLFVIYLFLITMLTDVFAYVYGMLFGKHPLTKISPKKSVEGSISGSIIATLVATQVALMFGNLFPFLNMNIVTIFDSIGNFSNISLPVQVSIVTLITLISSVLSQFGDLFASKIKREFDVKDYGNLFPGHGGVMDRFDSSVFTAYFLGITLLILVMVL